MPQAPLQPLQDNLESQTYETFERDPVKYKQYQEAVRRALIDRHKADGPEAVLPADINTTMKSPVHTKADFRSGDVRCCHQGCAQFGARVMPGLGDDA